MKARVLFMVYVRPGEEQHFEEAYKQVSERNQGSIPGQLYDELLRPASSQDPYILLSHWNSLEEYRAWEQTPAHRESAAPLRQYWLRTNSRLYILVENT
jgi:heme-degrading monooxygenase HmoA